MLQIGAEAANPGDDRRPGLGVGADLARQGEQANRGLEIDAVRILALGQGHPLGLGIVATGIAKLDVVAVGALAHRHRVAGRGIGAELTRPVVGAVAERPRVAALGVIRAADEGAAPAEPDSQASVGARRARARVAAAAVVGEDMRSEDLIECREHVGDAQLLGLVDRDLERVPELA